LSYEKWQKFDKKGCIEYTYYLVLPYLALSRLHYYCQFFQGQSRALPEYFGPAPQLECPVLCPGHAADEFFELL
jgi:hypothetical protein